MSTLNDRRILCVCAKRSGVYADQSVQTNEYCLVLSSLFAHRMFTTVAKYNIHNTAGAILPGMDAGDGAAAGAAVGAASGGVKGLRGRRRRL